MMNERLHAYYAAQVPSETCMVRLCNLNRTQKPKKNMAWLALPLAAACLLILVLVTQLRPARSGVTAPLATSAPTTQVTQPPAATTAPTDPPPQVTQYVESQQPEGYEPPAGGNTEPDPSQIGEGSENLMPAPPEESFVTGSYADGIVTLTDSATGETLELYVPEGDETEYTWVAEAFGRPLMVQLTLDESGGYELEIGQ